MKTKKLFAAFLALAALQTVSVTGQELFRVSFRGTARPGDGTDNITKITTRDLIEECVGTGSTAKELNQNFALVYNSTADSIQVVNREDASVVCEVFHFEGGTTRIVRGRLVRLTFVFTHGQSEANGSAVIAERSVNNNKPRINGKMQFTLPDTSGTTTETSTEVTNIEVTVNDQTVSVPGNFVQANALANVSTDQKICTGTFAVGRAFVPGVPDTSNKKNQNQNENQNQNSNDNTATGTEGQGSANDMTNTNGITGTNIIVVVSTNLGTGNVATNVIIPVNPNMPH